MTDEHDLIPLEPDDDDLRFAPPDSDPIEEADAPVAATVGDDELAVSVADMDELPPITEVDFAEFEDLTTDVDLDAALASISMLDDMLADQEAAEQAERARVEAEAEVQAEHRARLQNPEHFFPMPSMITIQRGRIDSVIPALALIAVGAWLTFALTTGNSNPTGMLAGLSGAVCLTLLARWLASGRWALGNLFFAMVILLTGGIVAYLVFSGLLVIGWPLVFVGMGLAFLVTAVLGGEYRLLLPGLVICFGSLAALIVTNAMLPAEMMQLLASLWPVALVIVVLLALLPRFARQK